jgi:hypothetical protein
VGGQLIVSLRLNSVVWNSIKRWGVSDEDGCCQNERALLGAEVGSIPAGLCRLELGGSAVAMRMSKGRKMGRIVLMKKVVEWAVTSFIQMRGEAL